MIYIIEFILCFVLLLYSSWKNPGLFPFNILFDGSILLFITIILFGISYMLSKLFVKVIKNDNELDESKLIKFSFTLIFIIVLFIFMAWSGSI